MPLREDERAKVKEIVREIVSELLAEAKKAEKVKPTPVAKTTIDQEKSAKTDKEEVKNNLITGRGPNRSSPRR